MPARDEEDVFFGPAGTDRIGRSSRLSVDTRRLQDARDWSLKQLQPFREKYVEAVKMYGGGRYGDSGLDKTPINMFRLTVDIWLRQLVSQDPRGLVLTHSPVLSPQAHEFELALNHLLREIRFGKTLAEVVQCAVFSLGMMKVGITPRSSSKRVEWTADPGQPYADPVLFEDLLIDMRARRLEECEYIGNRYRLPYDEVMENPAFSAKAKARLAPDESEKDESFGIDDERTSDMSTGGPVVGDAEYRKYVDLWDIWIPGDQLLVTLPAQSGTTPLLIREWEGPEFGPYHILSFSQVPGNIIPSAPIQHLYDLQDLLSRLFNKCARQAERQRNVTLVNGPAQSEGTGQKILESEDGEFIPVSHIDGVKEMSYDGVNPQGFQFTVWAKELFSYLAGNIDAMGGLSQQAGTATQEQLLVQSSSQMLADMQSKVVDFTKGVMKDLSWYQYTDPVSELPLSKDIDGFGKIPFVWGPEHREADFYEFNFEIIPHSLQGKSPQQRLGTIMQLGTQVFLPMAPMMQQWGMQFNLKRFVELIAKYSDLPEIAELIASETPLEGSELRGLGGGSSQRTLQAPSTQRNYTRTNVSTGGTAAAREGKLMDALSRVPQGGSVG